MKANELRLGNWVMLGEYTFPEKIGLAEFSILQKFPERESWIRPIPITLEILEKCGFENLKEWYENEKSWMCLFARNQLKIYAEKYESQDEIKFSVGHVENYKDDALTPKIKYLHQLQNLYFALTGEELKIEL